MAAYSFAPMAGGVDSLRLNAMFGGEHSTVDLFAKEAVVPARFSGSLVLAPVEKLLVGHLISRLEFDAAEGHKMGQLFEVIQIVPASALLPGRVTIRRANIVDEGCPLLLQFDIKSGENLWSFNQYGVNTLVNSSLSSAFIFNNNDTTKLIGFSTVPIAVASVVPATIVSTRPATASHADQLMGALALKNLIGWNVTVIESLFHNDCPTISSHAVQQVLNSFSPGSAMLESVLAYPGVLLALMSVSFAPFQSCIYPKDVGAKPSAVNYLWAQGYGADPSVVLSNEIVVEGAELTVRFLDQITLKLCPATGRGWFISLFRSLFEMYSRFSAKNVLAFSPAFNNTIMQEIFAAIEIIVKRPVPSQRTKSQLEMEFITLLDKYSHEYLLGRYREFELSFPHEAGAWTRFVQNDPEVQKVLPKFSGPSMVSAAQAGDSSFVVTSGPPPKKAKKEPKPKGGKKGVVASVPAVPTAVVAPPPPSTSSSGHNTRGKVTSLAMSNCPFNVRALFLNYPACRHNPCSKHHQVNVKEFTRAEMCSWVDASCKSDADYAALRAAIISKT